MKLILRKQRYFVSFLILLTFLTSLVGPVAPTSAADTSENADTPPAPVLIAPAHGDIIKAVGSGANVVLAPPAALPEFSWQPVAGATMYRIQIDDDIGFTNVIWDRNTPQTHYIPETSAPFSDGTWYWRVKVASPVASDFGNPRMFIKNWASTENIPVLTSPANDAIVEFYNQPVFSWTPVIGAGRYKFQISTAPSFSSLVYERVTIATTFQPEIKLENKLYHWRVVPLDAYNRDGTISAANSFNMHYGIGPGGGGISPTDRVPDQLTPTNNSFPTFTPTFSWTAVEGAQLYRLEYSTDPNILTSIVAIDTPNTTYTPPFALPNDQDYYWHVRSYSGQSVSDWSPTWKFLKRWYIQPVLLTPPNGFQHIRIPTFSWTPVPGASYYRIELDNFTDFNSPLLSEDTSNPFYTPREFSSTWTLVYWRVIPYDSSGNRGKESAVSSFASHETKLTPELISPLYYYVPNSFPPPFNTVAMQPYSDRTAALPVFYWHRLTAFPGGETAAKAYRVQVSTSSNFGTTVWNIDTENTHASPTYGSNFDPIDGQIYYWRVRGLDNLGGNEIGNWSQVWRTRFVLQPDTGATNPPPQLRRPVGGAEIVEATPVFEWWPVTGADNYQVQISQDPTFTTVADSGFVSYPVYSPLVSLAQRSLGKLDYGTYYWRVLARNGTQPIGDWSEVRRFQIASQSGRVQARILGDAVNRLQIASDPDDIPDNNFELTTLYAMQDSNAWYVGFNVPVTPTNMTYALYIDADHLDDSGGTLDPRGYNVTTIPAHRPEFALYINRTNILTTTFTTTQTELFAWGILGWNESTTLDYWGGELKYDAGTSYVEVRIPNTAIGMQDTTGSYAFSLFSVPASAPGDPADSVPSNVTIPGIGLIESFASTSERINAIVLANTPADDPTAYPSILPFEWDNPAVTNGTAPWAGSWTRVYRDPGFTTEVTNYQVVSNTPYYSSVSHHWPYDFLGDNTYYWRIQPCYSFAGNRVCGVWNQGGRFVRRGFLPENLSESVTFATPTFSWSLVEGAQSYDLQVDNNDSFTSPEVNTNTTQNSFTPTYTLNEGVYYWRVRVIRFNGSQSDWTAPETFTLTLPKPAGLTPDEPDENNAISSAPTFCWQPLLVSSNSIPVLAAYRYRLQVSKTDPNFSPQNIVTLVDTEQNCFTPTNGYTEGQYFWRVAMIDGQGRFGGYSTAATFWKQYPMAKPKAPVSGSSVSQTPTFVWTADDGITPYVFGAVSYRLEIAQNDKFDPLYRAATTNNTTFIPTEFYEINKTYYWRVAIVDADGIVGPWNTAIVILNPYPNKVFLPMVVR